MPFLLEGVAMKPELNQGDRIHPNAAGHRIVADNVWKVLEPVLTKSSGAHLPCGGSSPGGTGWSSCQCLRQRAV